MDRKDMDFARIWARRYISEHHPHGLDASDVENMILRRLHYNKDKVERGRKAALASALNEAQDEGRRNFRALVPWQVKRGVPLGVLARDMHSVASRQRVRERDRRNRRKQGEKDGRKHFHVHCVELNCSNFALGATAYFALAIRRLYAGN